MAEERLSRESFIHMAKMLGFDTEDPHMDDLYLWVEQVLKGIEPLDELETKGVEPALNFAPWQEE